MSVWLPPHDHAGRRDRLRGTLDGRWLLVSTPVNVRYLTGFTGSAGHTLVAPDPSMDRLLTDDRYAERVTHDPPDLEVELTRKPVQVAVDLVRGNDGGGDEARVGDGTTVGAGDGSTVGAGDGPTLCVEADHLTWARAREVQTMAQEAGLRLVGLTGAVAQLRLVKDDAEVARLTRANQLTAAALEWLFEEVVAPGRTERQLAIALERRFIDLGADGIAFPSIVASGYNCASPHHEPTDRELRAGELLTVDCGAQVDGYHADHTRTVGISHLAPEVQDLYDLVKRAQAAGRAAVVAGATTGEVDTAARGVIEEAGFGRYFVHGTGHGVGLEVHEAPSVAKGTTATLVPGMTLTVEPGVYVPGNGGVRIEDSLVVVPDGPAHPLTDAPRELRIL